MKIGIIVAMPEELKILVENLKIPKSTYVWAGMFIIREASVVAKLCYRKRDRKGHVCYVSVAVLVNEFKVMAVINTGSAGAVVEGLQIGDVVVADRLVYHDVDVTAFGYEYGQMARQPVFLKRAIRN